MCAASARIAAASSPWTAASTVRSSTSFIVRTSASTSGSPGIIRHLQESSHVGSLLLFSTLDGIEGFGEKVVQGRGDDGS